MLHDAESLGLSRSAKMRLIGAIGSLETEELDRFRSHYRLTRDEERASRGDEGRGPRPDERTLRGDHRRSRGDEDRPRPDEESSATRYRSRA